MQDFLFLYNELQDESVQLSIFGRVLKGANDSLDRYRLYPPSASLTADAPKIRSIAVPSDNLSDIVAGKVYEVSQDELLLSERYEINTDCPRTKITLKSGKVAWAYVASKPEYPRYVTYRSTHKRPSVLRQEFPLPSLGTGEVYYPKHPLLSENFSTDLEAQRFGAAQFCSFLADTIEVEHCLVIPAIASLRRLPFEMPDQPRQDLYKIATDEGFHAEQANAYLAKLQQHFNFRDFSGIKPPLFLRRLGQIRSRQTKSILRDLATVINAIVTETRISVELGRFAANHELSESVRRICDSHAKDEYIHSTQFQALGQWLWSLFDRKTKEISSELYVQATIARSLPDLDRIAFLFQRATGTNKREAYAVVLSRYNAEELIHEMLVAAKPTLSYLRKLGLEDYVSLDARIDQERLHLVQELEKMKKREI